MGSTGVFIFLFLSGYGISASLHIKGKDEYFIKRIRKVWLPYTVVVICFVIFSFLMRESTSFFTVVEYLSLIRLPVGIYWYLRLNIYWYIVSYILFQYGNRIERLVVISLLATVFIIIITGFDRKYIWQIVTFPLGFVAFTYQEWAIATLKRISSVRGRLVNLFIILIAFCIKKIPAVEAHELGIIDTLSQIIISAAIGLFIISFKDEMKSCIAASILVVIGGVSYELYLCHAIAYDYLADHTISFYTYLYVAFIVFCLLKLFNLLLKKYTRL